MTYLTMLNVKRYMTCFECWGVDETNIIMIGLTKITAFAFCCQDDQGKRDVPSLLSYLEYVYFFPAILIGPFFDYSDFTQMISRPR